MCQTNLLQVKVTNEGRRDVMHPRSVGGVDWKLGYLHRGQTCGDLKIVKSQVQARIVLVARSSYYNEDTHVILTITDVQRHLFMSLISDRPVPILPQICGALLEGCLKLLQCSHLHSSMFCWRMSSRL